MINTKKITIVIPTKNEINFLPRLFNQLKNQSIKDFDIIVVDNYSDDGTKEFCEQSDIIIFNGNLPGISRNIGAKNTTSSYLCFLDADVQVSTTFIEEALESFEKLKLDAASFAFIPDSNKLIYKFIHALALKYMLITNFFGVPRGIGGALWIKREVHININGFNEKVTVAEDLDYIKRISKKFRFKLLKNPKVIISVRRFEEEGIFYGIFRWIHIEFNRIFIGEIKNNKISYFNKD